MTDAKCLALLLVVGQVAAGEDSTVHLWVQRLHAPVQALRVSGDLADIEDSEPFFAQCGSGSASGEQLDALRGEKLAELDEVGLV